MQYNYYKCDGTKKVITAKEPLSLEKLQELVGGNIELIHLRNGKELFINEDGYNLGLPENPHFTEIDVFVSLSHSNGHLLGNVIEGITDEEGEFVGV